MIQIFLNSLINELGATGLLVIGLYWILYRPLRSISKHMRIINEELGDIRDCIKEEIAEAKKART